MGNKNIEALNIQGEKNRKKKNTLRLQKLIWATKPQFKLAIFTLDVAYHSWLHQLIKVGASGSF